MPKYAYRAFDGLGRMETGVLEADSERAAVASFQSRGFLVTSLTTRDEKDKERPRRLGGYFRVNRKDLVVVTRQLSTMVAAGLPIISALRILGEQVTNRRLRQVIARVRQGIERGGSLSDEIAKYPEAFFPFYVNTIRAGEVSGVLDTSMNYLADYLERELDLTQRVKTAATYPVVVGAFTTLVAVGAIAFVVPVFITIFASFKVQLPLITILVIRTSNIVRHFWWAGILLAVGLGMAAVVTRSSETGQRIMDTVVLKIPIVGPLVSKLALSRFGRAMAVLIRSGGPMLEGLGVVSGALGNRVVGDAVLAARERMQQGESMSQSLQRNRLIPPMVAQMVRVGEESGTVDAIFDRVAEFYEREVDNTVKRFASIVEPILIVGVGGLVALVALAVLMPIWTLIAKLPR